MWYFVQAINPEDEMFLIDMLGRPHSSDISDIEGFIVEDDRLKEIKKSCKVKVYDIPERYQDCIDDFVTDYWDGDFSFDFDKKYVEVK